jgi:hypothetical protein
LYHLICYPSHTHLIHLILVIYSKLFFHLFYLFGSILKMCYLIKGKKVNSF